MTTLYYLENLVKGYIYPGLFVGFYVFHDGLTPLWIIPAAVLAGIFPYACKYVDYLVLKTMTQEKKDRLTSKLYYAMLDIGALYYLLLTPLLALPYFVHKKRVTE